MHSYTPHTGTPYAKVFTPRDSPVPTVNHTEPWPLQLGSTAQQNVFILADLVYTAWKNPDKGRVSYELMFDSLSCPHFGMKSFRVKQLHLP